VLSVAVAASVTQSVTTTGFQLLDFEQVKLLLCNCCVLLNWKDRWLQAVQTNPKAHELLHSGLQERSET
jgi:hypothetical protein